MSGEAHRRRLRALLRLVGKRSGDLERLDRAFVHESYAREHTAVSNERMEFLGDAVLGVIVATWLYETFGDEDEGILTVRRSRIVNDAQLAQTALRLKFPELVFLGAGMRTSGGAENTSILADAFEAFVAALYLEYGLETARRFVLTQHVAHLDHDREALLDPKSKLQLVAQEQFASTPVYREAVVGTPQAPRFESTVSVAGSALGTGAGASKKAAQQAAAGAALAFLSERTTS